MRLVATEYLSLDGVFEEPGRWSGPFFNDEAGQFKWTELQASDALLLGRNTYERFGEKMNSMTKYVVSSTLDNVEWTGSQLVKGDLAAEVRRLKREPGHDLLLSGSAQLFNALMRENLIDLYRFMVHPVILGKGKRLFAEGNDKRILDLAETKRLSSGIVIIEYRPAKSL